MKTAVGSPDDWHRQRPYGVTGINEGSKAPKIGNRNPLGSKPSRGSHFYTSAKTSKGVPKIQGK